MPGDSPTLERLNRYLAELGISSRRGIDALIQDGRVRVNGRIATLGMRVEPHEDRVEVDGSLIDELLSNYVTLMLNKPLGVITSVRDPQRRWTVMDLVADVPGLVPVGRLDMDSRGLLLLSNDGRLVHRLTHPRYGVVKRYRIRLKNPSDAKSTIARLSKRVTLEDGPAQPVAVYATGKPRIFDIEMVEGRKREVRRICAASGFEVEDLCRIAFGPIRLGHLPISEWRRLRPKETSELYACVGFEIPEEHK